METGWTAMTWRHMNSSSNNRHVGRIIVCGPPQPIVEGIHDLSQRRWEKGIVVRQIVSRGWGDRRPGVRHPQRLRWGEGIQLGARRKRQRQGWAGGRRPHSDTALPTPARAGHWAATIAAARPRRVNARFMLVSGWKSLSIAWLASMAVWNFGIIINYVGEDSTSQLLWSRTLLMLILLNKDGSARFSSLAAVRLSGHVAEPYHINWQQELAASRFGLSHQQSSHRSVFVSVLLLIITVIFCFVIFCHY